MYQKIYPKAVFLRKGIIGFVIILTAALFSLIFYNLYHATHHTEQVTSRDNTKVEQVANQSDTNWYRESTSDKKSQDITAGASEIVEVSEVKHDTHPNLEFSALPQSHRADQNGAVDYSTTSQAMGASITTNQIIPEAPSFSGLSETPVNTTTGQDNGLHTREDDPNYQNTKHAFIKSNASMRNDDILESIVKHPLSPYEVQAGTIIPGILITGINSDLPGQITGQVRTNVYDSISGKHLLIPQGAKLTGLYDSQISYGQSRVLVVWRRIIFPNGDNINLDGMPGVDMSGYTGFHDGVNNHFYQLASSVILMSALSTGAQLSQSPNSAGSFAAPSLGQTIAQSLGTSITDTGTALVKRSLNIQPTLEIRPGYIFNISVTKDITFSGDYRG